MKAHRIALLAALTVTTLVLSACSGASAASESIDEGETVVRVGVPRNFGFFATMWARDVQPDGVKVEYSYFPNFTDMLQALNAGRIDITEVGDIGAIQSAVNGGKVKAVAVSDPNPRQEGLLVPADTDIQGPADLKGKRISLLRSTNAYPFVLRYIAQAGLTEKDITIVEVTGPDALQAYQNGDVDVYSTIDPNMADTQEKTGSKLLTTADGFVENLYPYVATTEALETKPEAIGKVLHEVANTIAWIQENPDEQAKILSPKLGFSETAIKTAYGRGATRLQPIDDAFYAGEQIWADEYLELGILREKVDVRTVFLPDFNDVIEAGK